MGAAERVNSRRSGSEPDESNSSRGPVAFALGGLGGGNAFGAGFLAAAQERHVRPAVISCTSGMIVWTAHFLAGHDLREKLREQLAEMPKAAESAPFGNQWMLAKGLPGVFRPAMPEYWERWSFLSPFSEPKEWADRLLPAQTWVPTRSPEYFQFVADTLAESETAVMFNAFCPPTGQEFLFLNAAACSRLGVSWHEQTPGTVYMPITAEGVEAALHLYSYGYTRTYFGMHLIDGAYHRQFILNELCDMDPRPSTIWVVRPQNSRWIGEMPDNYFEQRDMETEIGMNSSYAMQVSRIELMNKLVRDGHMKDGSLRPIQLEPFQFVGKRGYFDYFIESEHVFDTAFHRALDQFVARHGWQSARLALAG
ncbi:hypothetical protein [Uliginosibacterium aquaticum]|uniref:PNPLA domain-containing protein n=1 Tax=Uliginosibacterium aquaticum TaxID=2731212 RepID=A0ABX2ID43_9RHOO|nr:hypothetical protein [Uliginosibacterium aquaticum]NSL54434.1 hypothetical protein [Uliginosibacterium aquaticum]